MPGVGAHEVRDEEGHGELRAPASVQEAPRQPRGRGRRPRAPATTTPASEASDWHDGKRRRLERGEAQHRSRRPGGDEEGHRRHQRERRRGASKRAAPPRPSPARRAPRPASTVATRYGNNTPCSGSARRAAPGGEGERGPRLPPGQTTRRERPRDATRIAALARASATRRRPEPGPAGPRTGSGNRGAAGRSALPHQTLDRIGQGAEEVRNEGCSRARGGVAWPSSDLLGRPAPLSVSGRRPSMGSERDAREGHAQREHRRRAA